MSTVRTFWAPQRLNAAIAASFPPSVEAAGSDAKARLHNDSRSDVTAQVIGDGVAQLRPEGLASVFERGRRGGYEIVPREAQVLKVGDGFAAHITGGPMRSFPAMGPAGRAWALGGYQSVARRILSSAGFPPGRIR